VALATQGDTGAFERLYRKHVARIHSLARRIIGSEQADEVTQDIFVRAWERLASFRGEAAFGTWLYRLGINLALERRQSLVLHRSRIRDEEGLLERLPQPPSVPDFSMDFNAAIQYLPDGARQVFVLHDVEGYKHREIAVMLRITSGTSKGQLHRARMILRKHLSAKRPAANGRGA
jgi:RNA polymerase sigma-70 factor (ECF subfamily)